MPTSAILFQTKPHSPKNLPLESTDQSTFLNLSSTVPAPPECKHTPPYPPSPAPAHCNSSQHKNMHLIQYSVTYQNRIHRIFPLSSPLSLSPPLAQLSPPPQTLAGSLKEQWREGCLAPKNLWREGGRGSGEGDKSTGWASNGLPSGTYFRPL